MGSEPGMAWNWCVNLAKYCELHIITEGEFRDKIEMALPTLQHGNNMHFYYNPVSDEIRKMCWNQGDWRFYKYYKKWQWKTYLIAKDITKQHHIDVLHQLNMIGFREPGYLWKIKGKPFVWGPVDAKDKFPIAYLQGASLKAKLFIRLKNLLTCLQLKYSVRVRRAINRASYVISASTESKNSFAKYFNIDETGCYLHTDITKLYKEKDTFDLLWVGKMDFRKQLSIALNTLAKLQNKNIYLHIVGSGDSSHYKKKAEILGVENQCIWHGQISHDDVQHIMQESDLFFFTSVAEGTPHVVLEAIGNALPILCFNVCGQGDSVNDSVGLKIPLTNPKQSANDFTEKINYLYNNRKYLQKLSEGCKQRQKELSWDYKAKQMFELYKSIINE